MFSSTRGVSTRELIGATTTFGRILFPEAGAGKGWFAAGTVAAR